MKTHAGYSDFGPDKPLSDYVKVLKKEFVKMSIIYIFQSVKIYVIDTLIYAFVNKGCSSLHKKDINSCNNI